MRQSKDRSMGLPAGPDHGASGWGYGPGRDQALGAVCALFVAVLYLTLATFCLDRPGLYYDEMLFENAALGADSSTFLFLSLGRLPILLMPYLGALKAWLYAPIFALFGVSPTSVRLPVVLIGLGSVLLTYLLSREALGPRGSLAAAALTALEPSLLFHTRWDWGPTALMMFFKSALCLFTLRYIKSGRKKDALFALAAGALGVADKLTFLAVCGAALVATAVVAPQRLRDLGPRVARIALATLVVVTGGFVAVGHYDPRLAAAVLVTDPAAHVRLLADQVLATIKGVGVYRFLFFGSAPLEGDWHLIVWGASLVLGGLGAVLVPPGRSQRRFMSFFVVFGLTLLLELACVQRAVGPHHAVMLSPTWILCWAGLVDEPLRLLAGPLRSFRQRAALACAGLAFLGPAASSVLVSSAYWSRLGGPFPPNWDPATALLAVSALTDDTREYVSVDWGTHTVLQGLAQGQVVCLDLWPAFKDPAAHGLPPLPEGAAVFVLHAPGAETFPEAQAHFWQIARKRRWKLQLLARLPSSDGRPLLETYQAARPPQ